MCLVHFPKDHVCFGLFLGQLMVPGEGHGQNVKGAWSISQKVPALQLYGPHYLWEGPCLFWFVPWSVNGPKSSPQKNLVKM